MKKIIILCLASLILISFTSCASRCTSIGCYAYKK